MDDRMLMYNSSGDYQDESTTIDPAAVAWTHIQVQFISLICVFI